MPTPVVDGASFFAYGTDSNGQRISVTADLTEASVSVSGHLWGVRNLGLSDGLASHVAVTYPAGGDSESFSIYVDGVPQIVKQSGRPSVQADRHGVGRGLYRPKCEWDDRLRRRH